jgi:hypothetical protein
MPTAAPQPKKKAKGKGRERHPPRHSYRPVGRPTKLTKELWGTFLEKIRSGLPIKYAALAAGTHADSVERWRATVPGLEEELALAQGEAVDAAWKRIEQAGIGYEKKPPDWRADSWRLEKGFPEDFAKPPEVAVNNVTTTTNSLQITIIESRELEARTMSVDARIEELFNQRRRAIRDIE